MKAWVVGDKDSPEQIQDSLAYESIGEHKNTDLVAAIYLTEDSAKEAADYYSQRDRFDSGLEEPHSVYEVEIVFKEKIYTASFDEEEEENE